MNYSMTWADFYLICFAVGFCFSFFSFVLGSPRGHFHFPHAHGHAGGAHVQTGHASSGHGTGADGKGARLSGGHVSPLNPPTVAAFLAWFGGTGYLLTRYSTLQVGLGLLASVASGLLGGGIIFVFLTKVLMSDEENMDPADYEMVGVLGKISSSIREGGTGEIVYSQMSARRVCGARSEDNSPIAQGTEVVVTRYEKGIAYVRLWSEMSDPE
jgi:membrane protein implicated in regulation of membrane protease activity